MQCLATYFLQSVAVATKFRPNVLRKLCAFAKLEWLACGISIAHLKGAVLFDRLPGASTYIPDRGR